MRSCRRYIVLSSFFLFRSLYLPGTECVYKLAHRVVTWSKPTSTITAELSFPFADAPDPAYHPLGAMQAEAAAPPLPQVPFPPAPQGCQPGSPLPSITLPRTPTAYSPFQAQRDQALAALKLAAPAAAQACSPPAVAHVASSIASGESGSDACSWLTGWAALAAGDVVPSAGPRAPAWKIRSSSPACTQSVAGVRSPALASNPAPPVCCTARQPYAHRRKRKAQTDPAACGERPAWAAKLAGALAAAAVAAR